MRVIFIFIDGFGLGENDSTRNPIAAARTPGFDYIFENSGIIPVDTTLGVAGLPQSATGQTAIFTGVNASAVLGRHLSGQPTKTLVDIINENNIFKELIKRGFSVTYANVYRDSYLKEMRNPSSRKNRPSVTSVMGMSVNMEFRTVEDYKNCDGVYHDITGQLLAEGGFGVDPITPEEAARRLYRISRSYDFTLYEHFMTDIIGHKGNMELSVRAIELVDSFLGELVKLADMEKELIIITSDHGNIEDVKLKTHTMNKVPAIFIGKLPEKPELRLESLLDIMPAVIGIMEGGKRAAK